MNIKSQRYLESHKDQLVDILCDNIPLGVWFMVSDAVALVREKIPSDDRTLKEAIRALLKTFSDIERKGNAYRWPEPK